MSLAGKIKEQIDPHFCIKSFFESKKGPLRARYLKAHNQNLKNGFDAAKHGDIAAFIKNERYFEEKAPRMIMGRNPRFNLLYAKIIDPIEKAFFKLDQVANACDYKKCGEKFSKLQGNWFFENDMSKFEASQRWETLRLEYLIYTLVLPEQADFIAKCFAVKMYKFGKTKNGVQFRFNYCRGSGDMDTSLGNGILNYISTAYFQAINFCPLGANCNLDNCVQGCHTGKFVLKGDDSYGSMPVGSGFTNTYEYFGFDAKLLIRKHWWEVEFCSGHFIPTADGSFYFVQKLRKLLTSIQTCINKDIIDNGWVAHYYTSLGLMYNVLYKQLPVYEDMAMFLTRSTNFGINKTLVENNSYGANEAFENYVGETMFTDNVLLDISMVNDISITELNTLMIYLRNGKPVYPADQYRRSNRRNKPLSVELNNIECEYTTYCSFGKMNKTQRANLKLLTSSQLRSWARRLR